MLRNAMQRNAMQCNAMHCNGMQCNAMQCNLISARGARPDDGLMMDRAQPELRRDVADASLPRIASLLALAIQASAGGAHSASDGGTAALASEDVKVRPSASGGARASGDRVLTTSARPSLARTAAALVS